ncbi:MAG: CRISPR-associated ring nuclease Csm6 [bacterium]
MEHRVGILLGLHPKVFTESLYALCVKRRVPVSEVTVIATASAKQKTIEILLSSDAGKYHQLCREYPEQFKSIQFSANSIRVAGNDNEGIWDISHSGHSQAYLDLIMKTVAEITAQEKVCLHAVVAGGRRTLSVYLAMVMQLLAREQDRLYHLVVHPWEVETNSDFYYPTRESRPMVTDGGTAFDARDVSVELVEIPFIRLRNRLAAGKVNLSNGYHHLLAWVQEELNGALVFPELILDLATHSLKIGEDTVRLQPQQFAFYWYFADLSRNRPQNIQIAEFEKYFERPRSPYASERMRDALCERFNLVDPGGEMQRKFIATVLENRELPMTWVLQKISRVNERIRSQLTQLHLVPFYQISSVGKYGHKSYGIKVDGKKIQTPALVA